MCVFLVAQLCPTLCNHVDSSPGGFSVYEDSPGKNTGMGCHALLQRIFPTQGLNPGVLNCRQILHHLSHQGSPGEIMYIKKKSFFEVIQYLIWHKMSFKESYLTNSLLCVKKVLDILITVSIFSFKMTLAVLCFVYFQLLKIVTQFYKVSSNVEFIFSF